MNPARAALVVFALFLGACASPGIEFRGATRTVLSMGGDNITVFHKGARAQAVRTNWRNKKHRIGGIDRLGKAIEIATKCTVRPRSLRGDSVLITVSLRCP